MWCKKGSAQQKLVASGRDCASLKFAVLYLSLSRWTGRRFLIAHLPQAKRCVQFFLNKIRVNLRVTKYLLLTLLITLSCNGTADKNELLGNDYRLFQGTPSWDLAKAVRDKDIDEIRAIIQKGKTDLEFKEERFGQTILFLAVMNQNYESTKTLLELGANPNQHDRYDGTSPIIEAARVDEDIKFLELLLKQGGNPNDLETGERRKGNTVRDTPLLAAIGGRGNSLPRVELLVESGADIDFKNEFSVNALSEALTLDKLNVVLYLLNKGIDFRQVISSNEGRDYFIWDKLRFKLYPLGSNDFQKKQEIIEFLKGKGIDYRLKPIPDYAISQAKKMYPNNWKEYLEQY